MNFIPSRATAIERLNKFIESGLFDYAKLRNFDFGPQNRNNISCLSPYISHGVVNELEVIEKSLKKYSFVKVEKFIQEILWRNYWKGWLELRPLVWSDFLEDVTKLRSEYINNNNYIDAIEGKTNIECFNSWVNELKTCNYLHNHARMWFASIWIFTLNLPWQLGAEFFLKHLFDGDSASNTLGWRWVAGIQTTGKHYLASEWNIKKFTNNRFDNIKLNENAIPNTNNKNYSIIKRDFSNPNSLEEKNLILFDNGLSFESSEFKNYKFKKIFLIMNKNENRKIKLSENVIKFKNLLLIDQKSRLEEKSIDCEILDISEIKNLEAYAMYPSISENLDYLKKNDFKNIEFLYKKIDQFCLMYCNKGFFYFKNYIPKIISKFVSL